MLINNDKMTYFKLLSFDSNPIHTDINYSSRTILNEQTVYGILGLYECLEYYFQHKKINSKKYISEIDCSFLKNISLNKDYEIIITDSNIKIKKDNIIFTDVNIKLEDLKEENIYSEYITKINNSTLKDIKFEDVSSSQHNIIISDQINNFGTFYEFLFKYLDVNQIILLAHCMLQ